MASCCQGMRPADLVFQVMCLSPQRILTNTRSISVECWLTQNQANTWAEPWDFGNDGTLQLRAHSIPEQ